MTNFEKVIEFHDKYGIPIGRTGFMISAERALLRVRLHQEENAEVTEAMQMGDYVETAKELADLLYVVYGTAAELGLPINALFAEVHRSNMSKTGGKDTGGKITKGDDYEPADIRSILNQYYGKDI